MLNLSVFAAGISTLSAALHFTAVQGEQQVCPWPWMYNSHSPKLTNLAMSNTALSNARLHLANAIEDYLDGRIDNFALDLHVSSDQIEDAVCREIAGEVWFLYDDCTRHSNTGQWKLKSACERALRQWIDLLRSSEEWRWEKRHTAERPSVLRIGSFLRDRMKRTTPALEKNVFWPWANGDDWRSWAANSAATARRSDEAAT